MDKLLRQSTSVEEWRERAKRLPGISTLWPRLRAWQQEKQIQNEQIYYEQQACVRGITVLNQEEVRLAVQQRLALRGMQPVSRPRGELSIIYASEMTNWEPHQIPPALAKFGDCLTYVLPEHGHSPRHPDWPDQRHQFDQDLLSFVKTEHAKQPIDVFLAYLSGYHVAPETIQAIANLGIITCAFHWDDRLGFRGRMVGERWTGPASLAKAYDLNLTNATASLVKYFAEGGLAIFWPEAANPDHFRSLDRPFDYDVSFIGGCYGQRPAFINYLRGQGVKVEAFGRGWPNGPLTKQEMIEVYARSRINLGISGVGYSMKETCLKGRDFEVPMCGALYLTSEQPDLHRVYQVGREVVTYRNKDECFERISYLLAQPEECAEIRQSAHRRCLREHSWEQRFQDLLISLRVLNE